MAQTQKPVAGVEFHTFFASALNPDEFLLEKQMRQLIIGVFCVILTFFLFGCKKPDNATYFKKIVEIQNKKLPRVGEDGLITEKVDYSAKENVYTFFYSVPLPIGEIQTKYTKTTLKQNIEDTAKLLATDIKERGLSLRMRYQSRQDSGEVVILYDNQELLNILN